MKGTPQQSLFVTWMPQHRAPIAWNRSRMTPTTTTHGVSKRDFTCKLDQCDRHCRSASMPGHRWCAHGNVHSQLPAFTLQTTASQKQCTAWPQSNVPCWFRRFWALGLGQMWSCLAVLEGFSLTHGSRPRTMGLGQMLSFLV